MPTTSWRWARSCCASTPAKGGFAPPASSRSGKAAANTTWRAACAAASACEPRSCTAFADNDVGRLLEDFILQGGVDTEFIKWMPFDGVGRTVRNGLNFTERGFGVRGAVGVSDRGHTAASQLKPGDFDWDHIFGKLGVRWLHTGGIFAALSDTTPQLVLEAVQAARKHGTIVSYDLNYRPSLWKGIGGQATGAGSEPGDRPVRGCDDRQRRGFHGLPRF